MERVLLCGFLLATGLVAEDPKTVWSGIYSQAQAKQGESVYADACARCHRQDLSGYTGLRGDKFVENWRADSLQSLWVRISKTMPAGAPGSLGDSKYLEVLAFILRENDFPAGQEDLTVAAIPSIRFESKAGAEQVPDFALVQMVGCLAKAPDGVWRMGHASEPIRTRNPEKSSESELKAAAAEPLGDHKFRLLDGSIMGTGFDGVRRVRLKGFLIRKSDDDRINATSVEVLNTTCP